MIVLQVDYSLTPAGWTFMVVSLGFVTILLVWSLARVLRKGHSDKLRHQLDEELTDPFDS